MKLEEVRAAVAAIQALTGDEISFCDDEAAHLAEDELHQNVLRAIAAGTCEDPRACAAEALRTRELVFSRWYA